MINISTIELLRLWAELVECYHGANGFGGDTAEIYAYRLQPYSPTAHTPTGTDSQRETLRRLERQAARSLVQVVDLFCQEYKCRATFDGEIPAVWLTFQVYDHRVRIRIKKG